MRESIIYLYEIRGGKHCLYLGGYTTSEGLRLVSPNSQVLIQHLWAENVRLLPEQLVGPQSLESIARFVDTTQSIVDFECLIDSETSFSTHDDCECHFEFLDRRGCEGVLCRAEGPALAGVLWEALLANCRRYVKIDSDGVINFYDSFDHYLIRLR
jgi:hypothetical protein